MSLFRGEVRAQGLCTRYMTCAFWGKGMKWTIKNWCCLGKLEPFYYAEPQIAIVRVEKCTAFLHMDILVICTSGADFNTHYMQS